MNYVLIKRYNPIYDFFLFRYLKENGIDVNENVTLKEVERIAVSFQNKAAAALGQQPTREVGLKFSSELPQPERVLWYYAYSWKRQPDSRPSTSYSFEGIFGDKMPSTEQLKELEAQIPAGRGKLLFSKEEAAVEIVNFYKRYLTKSCDHGSEYVEVTCYLNVQNDSENVSLQPARGYRVWVKHNWEPDYADVIFPQYAVRKLES